MNGSRFFIPIQMFPNQKIWKCVNTCMAKWITTTFLLHPLMGEFWILKAPFSLKSWERGLQKQESKRGIFRCKILSQGTTCHKCEEGPLKATFATIAKTVWIEDYYKLQREVWFISCLTKKKKVNDKLLLPFAYLIRKGSQSWKQRRQNIFMCWISTWNRYAVESSFYRSRFLRNIYEGFLIVRVQRCTVSTPWCSETWGLQPVKITFLGHLFLMVARYSGNPS